MESKRDLGTLSIGQLAEIRAQGGQVAIEAIRKPRMGYEKRKTESEVFEYASSGEWGKLTEQERQAILNEMKNLRAKTDALAQFGGKGRTTLLAMVVGLVVVLIEIKRWGHLLPRNLLWATGVGGVVVALLRFLNSVRAPHMLNKPHPNGPHWIPFFGMTLDLVPEARKGITRHQLQLARKTNFETLELSMMGSQAISVMDPLDRKYILKDNWRNFLKNVDDPQATTFQDIFAEVLGRGIFSTDKREWQDHRKIASTMFSVNGLQSQMEKVFSEHSAKMVRLLDEVATDGRIIDIQALFQSFTFDTICEIAFGVSPDAVDKVIKGNKDPFLVAFDAVQCICTARIFEPKFLWSLKKWLGIGEESQLKDHLNTVVTYVNNIIAQRRTMNDITSKKDLLSLYIQFARKSGQSYIEEDAYLRDVILNFMIAGRDTTGCTLTNWFKLLGTSPNGEEVISKILNEYREKIPVDEATGEKKLNWDTTQLLTFSDAVFNETIRMYPPVSGDFRLAEEDDILPHSGFKVKRGTRVLINNISIGRDPHLWNEPDTFNPNRWVQFGEDGKMLPIRRPDEYIYPVFWAGARLCLGKDMARFEAKLVAVDVLLKYRFEVLPHEENYVNGPVMFYTQGVPARVKKV